MRLSLILLLLSCSLQSHQAGDRGIVADRQLGVDSLRMVVALHEYTVDDTSLLAAIDTMMTYERACVGYSLSRTYHASILSAGVYIIRGYDGDVFSFHDEWGVFKYRGHLFVLSGKNSSQCCIKVSDSLVSIRMYSVVPGRFFMDTTRTLYSFGLGDGGYAGIMYPCKSAR